MEAQLGSLSLGRWPSRTTVTSRLFAPWLCCCSWDLHSPTNLCRINIKKCCGSGMFIADPGSDFFPSRIRLFPIPDPGSDFFPSRIPDPNFFHPGSASKNLSILTENPVSKLSEIPMIRVVHPGSGSWFTHPGFRIQGSKSTGSRILNTVKM